MTWTAAAKTLVGVTAYHLPEDGTGNKKVRVQVGASYIDLDERQRRELSAYLLTELDA